MSQTWAEKTGEFAPAAESDLVDRAYRLHWDELCRHVRRVFGAGPPDPEDVAQGAFARFAALAEPEAVLNPRAFLFRTAHNIAIDVRRGMARAGAASSDPGLTNSDGRDFSPEDVLISRDELARLDAALAGLKPRQRAALLMHRLDDLSFAEIGRRMGISPSGARKLVEQGFAACMAAMKRAQRKGGGR